MIQGAQNVINIFIIKQIAVVIANLQRFKEGTGNTGRCQEDQRALEITKC